MIDIGSVGSGVKYHSLSYWSIVMTSPVEFSTGIKSPLQWHDQPGKQNKGLVERLGECRAINPGELPYKSDWDARRKM